MNRTITVKGTGKISKSPDQIALLLTLSRNEMEYKDTMEEADKAIAKLTDAVKAAGLDEKELRTQSFKIDTSYDSVRDKQGNYQRVFNGYECCVSMILRFPLDMKTLGTILSKISESNAKPEMNIKFQLADEDAVKDEMLIAATQDAKKKAELLAKAADVTLGQLHSIQYAWDEVRFESPTECDYLCDITFAEAPSGVADITPEDVEKTDTAVFVWEIV